MKLDDSATCLAALQMCDTFDAQCLATAACSSSDASCSSMIADATSATVAAGISRRLYLDSPLLGADVGNYTFNSGVVMYGMEVTISTFPVYCDHYHLYSFSYDHVTPADPSDSPKDLVVTGWSMVGFENLCSYADWAA